MSRGVERFYRWLAWRAGDDHECHWRQARIATELKVSVRTIQRWMDELKRAGRISVTYRNRREGESSVITVHRSFQMRLDFSVENRVEKPVENVAAAAMSHDMSPEMSGDMSGDMSGTPIRNARALLESLESLEKQPSRPARKPPGVEIPPEYGTNEYGRTDLNPAFLRVRDALMASEEKIRRARVPDRYRAAIIRRAMGGGP